MGRITLYVAAAIVCMALGAVATYRIAVVPVLAEIAQVRNELSQATAQAKANEAALNARQKAYTALEKKYQTKSKELSHALQQHREWADSRVPDAVFDSVFPDDAPRTSDKSP